MGALANAPAIASLEDAARAIPKNTVMLAYAMGDSASLLWAVDRDGYRDVRVARPRRNHGTRHPSARRDSSAGPGRRRSRRNIAAVVRRSSPWPESVSKTPSTSSSRPDGVLYQLPFEVLSASRHDAQKPWKESEMIARTHTTVYAPSVSVYVQLHGVKRGGKPDLDLLAFGAPDFQTLEQPLDALRSRNTEVGNDRRKGQGQAPPGVHRRRCHRSSLQTASGAILSAGAAPGHAWTRRSASNRLASSVALAADGGDDGYLHTLEIVAIPATRDWWLCRRASRRAGGCRAAKAWWV